MAQPTTVTQPAVRDDRTAAAHGGALHGPRQRGPWNWTPAHVEEFSADLRTQKHVAHSTLRGYHSALRAFTSYISNPDYGFEVVCEHYFGTHPAQVFFDWNTAPHVQEYDGRPKKRPYTREEISQLRPQSRRPNVGLDAMEDCDYGIPVS